MLKFFLYCPINAEADDAFSVLSIAAALVFVTGLATSTVTQSAIAYSTRLVPNTESKASLMVRTSLEKDGTEKGRPILNCAFDC